MSESDQAKYQPPVGVSAQEALEYKSPHFDYEWFAGDAAARNRQKVDFISGEVYVPNYDYTILKDRTSHDSLVSGGASIDQIAVLRGLSSVIAAESGVQAEARDLYEDMYDTLLQRELLVEYAAKALNGGSGERRALWREKFTATNELLYGPVDANIFESLLLEKKELIVDFRPDNEAGAKIKKYVEDRLDFSSVNDETSQISPLDDEMIGEYRTYLSHRYAPVLEVVPETDESVRYNAQDCQDIMQKALRAGGLEQKEWKVGVSDSVSGVTTSTADKTILLPSDTSRTAKELRALILHEQEVHARRGQNGLESSYPGLLANGTAKYAAVEEGLGICLEAIMNGSIEGNAAIQRAKERYLHVGLALGVDGIERDAREVFEITWRIKVIEIAKQNAGEINKDVIKEARAKTVPHIDNIFRGTDFAGKGVIYRKAKIYYEGFLLSAQTLSEVDRDDERFGELFLGKFDHSDNKELGKVRRLVQK